MSAIRKLIEEVRRLTFTNTAQHMRWHDKADAAEAELRHMQARCTALEDEVMNRDADRETRDRQVKELETKLEGANKLLADAWVHASKRDRADAELRAFVTSRQCLEADRHSIDPTYGHVSDECVMCVLARWVAKVNTRIVDEMMFSRPAPEVRKAAKGGKFEVTCACGATDIRPDETFGHVDKDGHIVEHTVTICSGGEAPRLPGKVSLEKWGASNGVAPESEKCPDCEGGWRDCACDYPTCMWRRCPSCNGTVKVGGGK